MGLAFKLYQMNQVLLISALLLLTACSSVLPSHNSETHADCVWSGTAQAWLDKNDNGVWDSDERPLSNVSFFIDDTLNNFTKVGAAISNLRGEAHLDVFLAGCPDAAFAVYPELPMGYRLTTPGHINADDKSNQNLFPFGFAYMPGVPTVTPRPSLHLACTPYPLVGEHQYGRVRHLIVAPDGTVWGSTLKGAFQFDPTNHSWKSYITESSLPSTYIESISIGPDGTLWFGTFGGVASFDGASWMLHRRRDGAPLGSEVVAAVTNDGVWLTSAEEASRLDPVTDKVITYPFEGEVHTDYIKFAITTPDGSLWAANPDFVSRLIPPTEPSRSPKWTIYRIPNEYTHYRTLDFVGLSVSSDGALWLAGASSKGTSVIRFDPAAKSWTAYDRVTTKGAILGEYVLSFALAPDDSIWLATSRNGVIQLTPSQDGAAHNARVVYHIEDILTNSEIYAISFAPDGAVWFGATGSIIRCTGESE